MEVEVLFSGVAVSDFEAARSWYERLFARPADIVVHENEVMWQVTERGWLYILRDEDRAGHGLVAIAVSDLEAATAVLEGRGVVTGPITPEGDAGRKVVLRDPDGNSVALIEIAAAG